MHNWTSFYLLFSLALSSHFAARVHGDQIRYDAMSEWHQWQLPVGAVELDRAGTIRPVRIRKEIDAVLNAAAFGGGIRNAGSNARDAALVLDGDPATGWSPDPEDRPEDWFIEIDLGRTVAATRVSLVFDESGPPFELFKLFLSTGEPAVDFVETVIEGTLIYRFQERFKENKKHRVTLELDPDRHPLVQFLRVEPLIYVPEARLVAVEVETIGDNIAIDLLERGGGLEIILDADNFGDSVPLGNALAIADGDFSIWYQHRRINRPVDVISHMTLDLGAVYWVDLVRMVGNFLAASGSRGRFNFDTYEVLSSDGSLATNGTRIWHRHFAGKGTGQNLLYGIANHHFELIQARYVRVAWVFWDAACAANYNLTVPPCQFWGNTRELQVFGEGYPAQVIFTSPLIDLGGEMQVNGIRWKADRPPDARVEVRSRTGNELEHLITYYDKNGKEVTEKKWNKLIPSFRGPPDTTSVPGHDWSPWSDIYLTPDEPFQSPSPRRYMELKISLVSKNPDRAAFLDYLEVEFNPPLADEVVGEISPSSVLPGEPKEFSYFVRATGTSGFDRLLLVASVPMEFREAMVEGQSIGVEMEEIDGGFQVTFPRRMRQGELVELRFSAPIFLQSTRFDAFLADSRQEELGRQAVESGDAAPQVASNTNIVELPVSGRLFANLTLSTPVLTPNGDGRNDALELSVDLVNVLERRLLRLRLFDLAGSLLREIENETSAGHYELSCDARDGNGRLVPPGLYLLELHVDGDAGPERVHRIVSVAY